MRASPRRWRSSTARMPISTRPSSPITSLRLRPLLGPDKLVRYSLSAGRVGARRACPRAGARPLRARIRPREDEVMDDETAALLFGLGRAQVSGLPRYEVEPAVTSLRRAFDHYADSAKCESRGHGGGPPDSLGHWDSDRRRYAELIARASDPRPSGLPRGGTAARATRLAVRSDRCRLRRSAARPLTGAVDRTAQGDAALERRTLANAAFVDAFHLRWQDCLTEGLRAIDLAQRVGDLKQRAASAQSRSRGR